MARIAFLGLGEMGRRMAGHLLDAHELVVHNRTRSRADSLVAAGARWADSAREAARDAEFVFSMVTDDDAAASVWLDPDHGALAGLSPGAMVVESSTVTPGWIARLGDAVDAAGARLVDAPVAGSTPQAEARQLAFLVGGAHRDVVEITPLLESMGRAVLHAGERGHGAVLKLAVNTLFATQVAVVAELLAMLADEGVDVEHVGRLLVGTPVASPAMAPVRTLMMAADHAPRFPVDLVRKDLGYAVADRTMPVAQAVMSQFERASQRGHGGDNLTAVRLIQAMRPA